jgi:uncharacterized protein with HEPN domain
MVHHLLIIGEAARAIDPAVRQRYPTIPWRQIAGMRNILVHDYFRINQAIVWETIENHLPSLNAEVKAILNQLPMD